MQRPDLIKLGLDSYLELAGRCIQFGFSALDALGVTIRSRLYIWDAAPDHLHDYARAAEQPAEQDTGSCEDFGYWCHLYPHLGAESTLISISLKYISKRGFGIRIAPRC